MAYLDYDGLQRFKGKVDTKLAGTIAAEYSTSATYAVGDFVIYKNNLYKCNTAISTAEAWTAAHWSAVSVGNEVSDLNQALISNTKDVIANKNDLRKSKNLVDKNKLSEGKMITSNGTITSVSGYSLSDYILIDRQDITGDWMYSSVNPSYAVFDSNLNFLRSVIGNTPENRQYTYIEGDAYLRANYRHSSNPDFVAYYGTNLLPYEAYSAENMREISEMISDNQAEIESVENSLSDISTPETYMEFSAYDPHIIGIGSSTFRGFATRYSHNGVVNKVGVYARFGGAPNINVTVEIRTGDFATVLAQKTIAVTGSDTNQTLNAEFDAPIKLTGDFYIVVYTDSGYVASTSNETSAETTATASGSTQNKYVLSTSETLEWLNCNTSYCLDLKLYRNGIKGKDRFTNIKYIGSDPSCDFPDVQSALSAIDDDTEQNPYVFVIMPGTYETFTMKYTNNERTTARTGGARWISLIGLDAINTVFFDNRGNYLHSPCEIWTNGTVKNLSFIDKTDAEHHTQEQDRTFAYAVHLDFGTCRIRFENCYFYSNAGPGVGIGTYKDELLEFYNCRFETDVDGTYGSVGHGAFFAHTQTSGASASDRTNQNLHVHDSLAIATGETNGARLAVIAGFEGTYSYELQNFGSFGENGASVSLQAPDNDLLSNKCFNNIPSILNTAS